MIGHYLLTLTPEQEDRVLTLRMGETQGKFFQRSTGNRCLVGAAEGLSGQNISDRAATVIWGCKGDGMMDGWECAPFAYDHLCNRFGFERVNRAIRNRILANKARRELAPAMAGVA